MLSGGLTCLLGGGVVAAAFQMPMGGTYGGVENPWYASPGSIPLLLGSLFLGMGLVVLVNGWRQSGGRLGWGALYRQLRSRDLWMRTLVRGGLWLGLCLYVALLGWKPFGALSGWFARVVSPAGPLGFLVEANGANYWVSSSIFLIVLVRVFRRSEAGKRKGRWFELAALVLAPLALAYVFSTHLRVPLP